MGRTLEQKGLWSVVPKGGDGVGPSVPVATFVVGILAYSSAGMSRHGPFSGASPLPWLPKSVSIGFGREGSRLPDEHDISMAQLESFLATDSPGLV